MLCKPSTVFLHFVECVVANGQKNMILAKIGVKLKRGVQRVRSVLHLILHIGHVEESAVFTQNIMRQVMRFESMFPLSQYKKSFFFLNRTNVKKTSLEAERD